MSHGILVPKTPKETRDLLAYHESRHCDIVQDDCALMLCTEEFIQGIEGEGIRRKVMHDLGFNMEPDAEQPERIRIDLGKGYSTFNHEKNEYEVRKGKGYGALIFQGDKNGVA